MAKNTTIDPPDNGGDIIEEPINEALSKRYLAYALSTITARALPDARDGLKPVHRRILYAMSQLGLNPTGGHRKSATVVGEVIGKYHPHGDQSIYDAMCVWRRTLRRAHRWWMARGTSATLTAMRLPPSATPKQS
jgi:DNA gyrase/topoisomerase IV subunit A